MMKLKTIVVDDHTFFREGVIFTLKRFNYIDVIGEASNGEELLKLLDKNIPHIILMDIRMPEMDGIKATKLVIEKYPKIKILAFSMFGDEKYLESMLEAGACGFILKNTDSNELNRALQAIAQDQQYFSSEFIPFFTNKYLNKNTKKNDDALTNRELEILQLVAQGLTNQEIADKLFISLRTVTSHRANMNMKTGSTNTVKLLTYAIRNKLINF